MENKPQENNLEIGELHEQEKRLILAIRHKYQFGELKILTRHGLPYRVKITERFESLTDDQEE